MAKSFSVMYPKDVTKYWKVGAAGIAAASVLAWGLARREASSRPAPPSVPAASTAEPAVPPRPVAAAAVKPPGKAVKKPPSAPVRTAKARGAGLLEKGEALGGTAP